MQGRGLWLNEEESVRQEALKVLWNQEQQHTKPFLGLHHLGGCEEPCSAGEPGGGPEIVSGLAVLSVVPTFFVPCGFRKVHLYLPC